MNISVYLKDLLSLLNKNNEKTETLLVDKVDNLTYRFNHLNGSFAGEMDIETIDSKSELKKGGKTGGKKGRKTRGKTVRSKKSLRRKTTKRR